MSLSLEQFMSTNHLRIAAILDLDLPLRGSVNARIRPVCFLDSAETASAVLSLPLNCNVLHIIVCVKYQRAALTY